TGVKRDGSEPIPVGSGSLTRTVPSAVPSDFQRVRPKGRVLSVAAKDRVRWTFPSPDARVKPSPAGTIGTVPASVPSLVHRDGPESEPVVKYRAPLSSVKLRGTELLVPGSTSLT